MRDWVETCWQGCLGTAHAHGFGEWLAPIGEVLAEGNPAQQWLVQVADGREPREVMRLAIAAFAANDRRYDADYLPRREP